MQLIADGDARAAGQRKARLIYQGVGMLEAAELAPGGVEFARHAQEIHAQGAHIRCGHGEMIVAPAACGQAFQLQMGVIARDIPPAVGDVARVVEDGGRVGILAHRVFHAPAVVGVHHFAVPAYIRLVCGVHALFQHGFHAAGAGAHPHIGNIQKNAAGIVSFHDLLHLGRQHVQIGRVVAH